MAGPVHYEVFIRRTAPAPWTLLIATEDRKHAMTTAEEVMADSGAAAVRVTKETLDSETMEFNSLTILTRGAPETKPKPRNAAAAGPACTGPMDLYAPQARALIARVLEDWLARQGATTFELLHRPDLAERLEASGVELQHAIQKVAVPESQATGQPIHDLMRHYQRLADAAIDRLIKHGRREGFPDAATQPLAGIAERLKAGSDRAFVMGGVLSAALKDLRGARARLSKLADLIDAAPPEGGPRALVLVGAEQIASEMLGDRKVLAEVLGPALDQGGSLAAVIRMVAPREVEALTRMDPRLALLTPTLDGPAARLGAHLDAGEFPLLAASLARMVVRELMSPRRLRPSDARGEIDILRALAMSLTATAGRLLTLEEVQNAFVERSKALVAADFVQAYVAPCDTVLCEAEHLMRLCENVTGAANKRAAARWLHACITSLRFETEMRKSANSMAALATLARLQKAAQGLQLNEQDEAQVITALGVVGGAVETESRLLAQIVRAGAAPAQKLSALLRLGVGETAPLGPAADRAKAEALRLLRAPETRTALAAAPAELNAMRDLMTAAGLAA